MKKSLSHTIWECKYHIVAAKKRSKYSYGKLRKEIGEILRKLYEYRGVVLVEEKSCIDHIHLIIGTAYHFSISCQDNFLCPIFLLYLLHLLRYRFSVRRIPAHTFTPTGHPPSLRSNPMTICSCPRFPSRLYPNIIICLSSIFSRKITTH